MMVQALAFIRKTTKIALILMFVAILSLGMILSALKIDPDVSLKGVTTPKEIVFPQDEDKLKAIMRGEYSSLLEQEYEESSPLREILIKTKNTMNFILNKSSNSNVTVGKNHNLFEPMYLQAWCVTTDKYNGVLNEPAMKKRVEKLAFIQEELKKRGKEIYVLLTPNKAEFYEEDIPESYWQLSQIGKENVRRNADVLRELLDQYDIPYIDGTKYIKEKLPSDVQPFARSGIHYTWATGGHLLKAMYDEIALTTDLTMPEFSIKTEEADGVAFPNFDLYDLQNTWQEITDYVYESEAQQNITLEDVVPCDTKIFVQGGSFVGAFISMNIRTPGLFKEVDYVQNTTQFLHGKGATNLSSINDVDLDDVIANDLFVFEVNDAVAHSLSFGFIDCLADYLREEAPAEVEYPTRLTFPGEYNSPYIYGIHLESIKSGWCFTSKKFGYALQNSLVSTMGLSIKVTVLDQLIQCAPKEGVMANVCINGTDLGTFPVSNGKIVIPPEIIPKSGNDIYSLDVTVNSSFRPSDMNPASKDSRELSLILVSISAG